MSRYSEYQYCPSCDYQFVPEEEGQRICKLCRVAQSSMAFKVQVKDEPPKQLEPRNCEYQNCLAEFTPINETQRFCTRQCQRKASYKRQLEADKTLHELTCATCDETFFDTDKRKVTCSPGCGREHSRRLAAARRQRRREAERQQVAEWLKQAEGKRVAA